MSYITDENSEFSPIHVTNDSSSDESDSVDCKLIRHQSKNYDYADENDVYDYDFFSPIKNRNAQSKSLKQFLFVIGFASTLIILSQLYLTFYYGDPLGSGQSRIQFACICCYNFTINFAVTVPGWDRNRTRKIPIYVLPTINTTLIEPTSLCKVSGKILLIIVICSSPDNFKTRCVTQNWIEINLN